MDHHLRPGARLASGSDSGREERMHRKNECIFIISVTGWQGDEMEIDMQCAFFGLQRDGVFISDIKNCFLLFNRDS